MRAHWFVVVIAVAASTLVPAAQAPPQASESDVKAAYLYQFSTYVEWPEASTAADPMTMCVAGDGGVAGALQKIASDAGGARRKVVVRQVSDPPQTADCQVLFIGRGEEPHAGALLKALEGKPALTAGDDMMFLRRGGMVAFLLQDRKVRFSISLAATQAAHLKVSSQLLRHAVQVIQ